MSTGTPIPISHIRPLDTRRDLADVADLIEICFSATMDSDGLEYLRHIRRASQNSSLLHWIPGSGEMVSYPLHGYVWVEEGKVVGNLTLIPHFYRRQWLYLIVNVAVHPNYRQRGIGRELTRRGIVHAREHGAASAWLQVRDDNLAAYHLYLDLGFKERVRRTTWRSKEAPASLQFSQPGIVIRERSRQDWDKQSEWLAQNYPPEVAWNLSLDINHFKPSLWNEIAGWLEGNETCHWSAFNSSQLLGLASREPSQNSCDNIWLAIPEANDVVAIRSLLSVALKQNPYRRPPLRQLSLRTGGWCLYQLKFLSSQYLNLDGNVF